MTGGGWSCPHEVEGKCSKIKNLPCDPGDTLIVSVPPASFAEKIAGIERRLNHFLTTGTMLKTINA